MRSRHAYRPGPGQRHGITSACAEQTECERLQGFPDGDHLRVCGADGELGCRLRGVVGSPPRVRSRRYPCHHRNRHRGITSACAEQTRVYGSASSSVRDHLRVCGADQWPDLRSHRTRGSPPRVRSRLGHGPVAVRPVRITSACAEQTTRSPWSSRRCRDHLRVCGAD